MVGIDWHQSHEMSLNRSRN